MVPVESLATTVSHSHFTANTAVSLAGSTQHTNVTDNVLTPHDGKGRAYA